MRYRQLDSNWDYIFGKGTHAYLEGSDAVAQAIKSRLQLLYREWWEDREDGLPLWEKILGTSVHPQNLAAVDSIYVERILGTEGVVSIMDYESSFENRQYTFKAAVVTLYGLLIVTGGEDEEE